MDFMGLLSRFLNEFLPAVAGVLATLLTTWGMLKIKQLWAEMKNDRPDLTFWLEHFAGLAVKAAEQAGASQFIDDKKSYAIQIVERLLQERGLAIDLDLVDAAVEAAVLTEFNRQRETDDLKELDY